MDGPRTSRWWCWLAALAVGLLAAPARAEDPPAVAAWRTDLLAAARSGDAGRVAELAQAPAADAERAVAILAEAGEAAAAAGHPEAAVAIYQARFVLATSLPDAGTTAKAALQDLQAAVARTPDPHDDAMAKLYAGGMEIQQGHAHEAIPLLDDAVQGLEGHVDQAQAYATLALAHLNCQHVGEALHGSEAATRIAEAAGEHGLVVYAHSITMAAYSQLGLDLRIVEMGAMQEAAAGDALPDERAFARLAMAISEARLGRRAAAAAHFQEAIAWFASRGNVESLANALLNRGRELLLPTGSLKEARADFERVRALEGVSGRLRLYAAVSLADVQGGEGHWPEARAAYAQVVADARAVVDRALTALALTGLAEAYVALGAAPAAYEHAQIATATLLGELGTLAHVEGVGLLGIREWLRTRQVLLAAAFEVGDPAEIQDAIEDVRSMALLANAGGWERLRQVALPAEVALSRERAEGALDDARRAYGHAKGAGAPLPDQRRLREASRAAEQEFQRAQDRLQRETLRLSDLVRPDPVTFTGLQGWLQPAEAFVHYVLVGDVLEALVVRHGRPALLKPVAKIDALHKALDPIEDFRHSDGPVEVGTDGRPTALRDLRRLLLDPLELPATIRRVVISPDPRIANLPWPLLVEPASPTTITVTPSATLLLRLDHAPVASKRPRLLVGVSDYRRLAASSASRIYAPSGGTIGDLPGAAVELAALTRKGVDQPLDGERATEASVGRALAADTAWSTLHFACHGLLNHDHPSLSSLALLPGEGRDGFLTVTEVLSLRMRCGLVVLSACDTGTMLPAPGEGYVGLPPALLAAGAPRVLCSLWKVNDDAGAAFMGMFYDELDRAADPAEALRAAQQRLRAAHPEWSHPYYWAGWVLWGSPR